MSATGGPPPREDEPGEGERRTREEEVAPGEPFSAALARLRALELEETEPAFEFRPR